VKNRKKLPYVGKLLIAMGIYAAIFIALVGFGLTKFWGYIAAYENSQTQNTIDSYMAQLDTAHIQDCSAELIASIDHNVQSEEACRQAIADAVSGGISYARKLSECTDDKMVYMLMSGGKTIGKVSLRAQEKDAYGFSSWEVAEDSFDFSFLLGESASICVPQDYCVYANGSLLSKDYITKSDTPFEMLKDFYADYTLPYMVTYTVAPVLGDVQLTITDPAGNSVTPEDAANEALVLNNCTQDEITALDTFTTAYLDSYARFSTNSGQTLQENYQEILTYFEPGSALADRMTEALVALEWVNNRTTKLASATANHRIRLSDGYYLCDITYAADITRYGETTTTTESVRLIVKQTESGLKVERMINY